MKIALIFAGLIAAISAFGIPPSTVRSRATPTTTALYEFLSPEERVEKIQQLFDIRNMSAEEAKATLSGEDLEAYNDYFTQAREGVLKMKELAILMMKNVDPPRIMPKSKGQRKRDRWARVQAREAAKASS